LTAREAKRGALLALSMSSVISMAQGLPTGTAAAPVRAVVLGIAQDGGVPHIGCYQELCVRARQDPGRRERVACLGLIAGEKRFLVDATPDLPSQIDSLNVGRTVPDRARPVDGILLTHAHIGHYTGLMYLGREALGARGVPVYATHRMAAFLRTNGPWSQLVTFGNIELREIEAGRPFALADGLSATALEVPHRDEWSDTVAFRVEGPGRRLLYLPDIDKWEKWGRRLEDELAEVAVALLDGTFESETELPGRSLLEIPHPLVGETVSRLSGKTRADTRFIHLNHTNRLLSDEPARRALGERGFRVARDGDEIPL
jgi:pyrroloquinoline quinone biosynthesis protein B